ncbi:MAG TPA: LytR family transcriptional regulator [Peptococcaceae bacterium]|nr:LytR family transcriptional regulator [Peptococcaceae bacterium]
MDKRDMEETKEWKAVNVLRPEPGAKERPTSHRRRPGCGCGCGCATVLLLLLILIVAGGWYLGQDILPGDTDSDSVRTEGILLLGIDRESSDQPGRSDTIVLAFLNSEGQKVSLLSIPRDTYTDVPARGKKDKVNHAYAAGGAEATMEAVGLLLNRDIKHYVATDFQGFVSIIDTLGGINVSVDEETSAGIDIPPGMQRLRGEEALRYVRYRGYANADIGRIERQQIFLKAVADEALQPGNILKAPSLAGELGSAVETNMNMAQLLRMANSFKSLSGSEMDSYILPGRPQYIDGISYWVPDTDQIEPLMKALEEGTTSPEQ